MDDMGNEIKSIECCIAALNGKVPEDGGQWVLETLRAMYEVPYKGRGLGIGSHRTGRISWGGRREWAFFVEDLKSPLSWLHVLLVLFDGANLNEKEMFNYAQQITKDNIIYNHVLEHILENLAAQDAVEEVKKHIPFFATSNVYADNGNDVIGQKSEEALGWRILLRYYAQKADTDNFFKIFKLCEPGKDRPDLERIKRVLVQSMMRAHGIEAVIKLLGHRNIGERYTQDALEVLADDGEYVKLKELFARYPQLTQSEATLSTAANPI
ncbi:hypothetical protein FACS1894158_18190 [Betaproteobacteria bacterium]|nr:hypothetical protein FACS1894158_18190 [Betaproteobacteria bacterium]